MILYVNNVKLIESDKIILNFISQQIAACFDIKNLDHTHHYLDMKMKQNHKLKTI